MASSSTRFCPSAYTTIRAPGPSVIDGKRNSLVGSSFSMMAKLLRSSMLSDAFVSSIQSGSVPSDRKRLDLLEDMTSLIRSDAPCSALAGTTGTTNKTAAAMSAASKLRARLPARLMRSKRYFVKMSLPRIPL